MNVLYDLKSDPHEMNNLLGKNPDKEKHRRQVDHFHLGGVRGACLGLLLGTLAESIDQCELITVDLPAAAECRWLTTNLGSDESSNGRDPLYCDDHNRNRNTARSCQPSWISSAVLPF